MANITYFPVEVSVNARADLISELQAPNPRPGQITFPGRRWVLRVELILALLGIGAGVWTRMSGEPPPTWRTAEVTRANLQRTVSSTGTLEAVTTVGVDSARANLSQQRATATLANQELKLKEVGFDQQALEEKSALDIRLLVTQEQSARTFLDASTSATFKAEYNTTEDRRPRKMPLKQQSTTFGK